MAKPLRFHPLVADDTRAAERWYAGIAEELGESFRELLNARFDDIEAHPHYFGIAFDDVRFAKLSRLPYLVLFEELEDAVFVLGVFHGSSDPDKWRARLLRD